MKKNLCLLIFVWLLSLSAFSHSCNLRLYASVSPFTFSIYLNRDVTLRIVDENGNEVYNILRNLLPYNGVQIDDSDLGLSFVDFSNLSLDEEYRIEYKFNGFFSYQLYRPHGEFSISLHERTYNNTLYRPLVLTPSETYTPTHFQYVLNEGLGYSEPFTLRDIGIYDPVYLCISVNLR